MISFSSSAILPITEFQFFDFTHVVSHNKVDNKVAVPTSTAPRSGYQTLSVIRVLSIWVAVRVSLTTNDHDNEDREWSLDFVIRWFGRVLRNALHRPKMERNPRASQGRSCRAKRMNNREICTWLIDKQVFGHESGFTVVFVKSHARLNVPALSWNSLNAVDSVEIFAALPDAVRVARRKREQAIPAIFLNSVSRCTTLN